MRAVRVFALITLLVAGLAGTSFAQYSIPALGVPTPAKIGVVPGALPDAGLSLPPELRNVGPDLYTGEVIVSSNGSGYSVQYKGERADGAKLLINANFDSGWAGLKFGSLTVGSSVESGVITGDDVAHLISANINGVGTVDGVNQRVIAKIGAGGVVERFTITKAPGPLR